MRTHWSVVAGVLSALLACTEDAAVRGAAEDTAGAIDSAAIVDTGGAGVGGSADGTWNRTGDTDWDRQRPDTAVTKGEDTIADTDDGTPPDGGPVSDGTQQPDGGPAVDVGAPAASTVFGTEKAYVVVPAGALEGPVTISVAPAKSAPTGAAGPAWEFGPDGQTFAKPVRIVLHASPEDVPDAQLAGARVALATASGWQPLQVHGVDLDKREVWGETTHFSSYAVWLPQKAPDFCAAPCTYAQPGCDVQGTEEYGACKWIFVVGFNGCPSQQAGYDVFFASLGCCQQLRAAAGSSAGNVDSVATCLQGMTCEARLADPIGAAAACGAFGPP